jgi:glycosyltransferase involved in cell wall biosynthesis
VPTYRNIDNFRYLYNLESILGQDYTNFKIILIDDASRDGNAELIREYLATKKVGDDKVIFYEN